MARVSTLVALLAALMQLDNSLNSALTVCDATLFPQRSFDFTHISTLPVTTCSAHRSFNVLRLTKTYIRSTVDNDCLNDLALLSIRNTTKWLRKLEHVQHACAPQRLTDRRIYNTNEPCLSVQTKETPDLWSPNYGQRHFKF